ANECVCELSYMTGVTSLSVSAGNEAGILSQTSDWQEHDHQRQQQNKPFHMHYGSIPTKPIRLIDLVDLVESVGIEIDASVVEWSITTDCKSVGFGLRWFESSPTHQNTT